MQPEAPPAPGKLLKAELEEQIYKDCQEAEGDDVTSSMYEEEDSTSIDEEDSQEEEKYSPEQKAALPELSNDQADTLAKLLLSPLEPDVDF